MNITDIIPADRWNDIAPTVQRRIRVEVKVVETAIARILATGNWKLIGIDNGDEVEKFDTIEKALPYIFDLDDCSVLFKTTNPEKTKAQHRWFRVVLGNDGYDAISDYSAYDDDFQSVLDGLNHTIDEWERGEV